MKKATHLNLYERHSKQEVYDAMQEHTDRDSLFQLSWKIVFFCCAAGAVYFANKPEWLWIFGGLYALERSVCHFMDNVSRNWFMHHLDLKNHGWDEEPE